MSRFKSSLAVFFGYGLLRLLSLTWRYRVEDRAGLIEGRPVIWLIWHNRLLPMPYLWRRFFRQRTPRILVSRSKDGAIIAGIIQRFGGTPVRGSSSRGGASALAELTRAVRRGCDAYITPDGPRGPCYSVSPGPLWLAQETGARLMAVSIEASSFWRLKSWDRFFIPKPFAKIEVTLCPLATGAKIEDEARMKVERERLREAMLAVTRTR